VAAAGTQTPVGAIPQSGTATTVAKVKVMISGNPIVAGLGSLNDPHRPPAQRGGVAVDSFTHGESGDRNLRPAE
jgi:hypothetical protein